MNYKVFTSSKNTENGEHTKDNKSASLDVGEFSKMQTSYYDSSFMGEYERLKTQGEAMRPSDMAGVNYVKDKLKDLDRVCILDVGCGYGVVGRDRFSEFSNKVIIGIDV